MAPGNRAPTLTRLPHIWIVVFTFATAVTLVVLAADSVPLGVVGEWTWQRHVWPVDFLDAVERFLPAFITGGFLCAVASFASTRDFSTSHLITAVALVTLIVAGWAWIKAVQHSAPSAHRVAKPYFVLYDPGSSGYFFEAAFHIDGTGEFLRGYEARMREGDVLHVGTHPPGLFLLHRFAIDLCRSSPKLVELLSAVEDRSQRGALRQLMLRTTRPLEDHEIAALHLVSALTTLAAAAVVLPLFALLRTFVDGAAAWKVCCLWPTVPAIAIFFPKSDVLFTLIATTGLALGVIGIERRRTSVTIASGLVLWLGLIMSLAHLTVFVALILFVAVRAYHFRDRRAAADVGLLMLNVAVVLTASITFSVYTDCNLFNVWRLNLANHEAFYEQFSRTWWMWLLVNPVELSFAIGLPLILAAGAGVVSAVRRELALPRTDSNNHTTALIASLMVTIMLLWLSGKNQGEAARLWCFMMPWFLVAVAHWPPLSAQPPSEPNDSAWHWLLVAQLTCGLTTVSRVSGFMF